MRVSVIIPTTPRDVHLLKRAVGSVEAQTRKADEVIVWEDSEYKGIPWARNSAFAASTGDLILPLDCDDWIEPTYLEKTMAKMEDPNIGIVSTHMVYFGEREGTIIYANERTYERQLMYNNITVCSLVRAEAIAEAGPWDDNLRGWEDWDMWLRILKLGWKHAFVPEVLFHYRLHHGGMNQWANENRAHLIKYLTAKHPGFLKIRETGAISDNGEFRKEWNGL